MTNGQRITKQFVIALIFFVILGGAVFGLYRTFRTVPSPATPNPTINLAPIKIFSAKIFNITNSDYDFIAKVNNPNTDYGSPSVVYEMKFFNAANVLVDTRTASFYILPGQTKYIFNSPMKFAEPVTRFEVNIKSVDWQKLDPLSATGVSLVAKDYNYVPVNKLGVFSKVGGAVYNNSNYDLGQIEVLVLLFDNTNSIIAVNRTEIRTFLAKTTRGFEVSWFEPFTEQVNRVEVEANTNVFENSNFLRQYEQPEQFQQYY